MWVRCCSGRGPRARSTWNQKLRRAGNHEISRWAGGRQARTEVDAPYLRELDEVSLELLDLEDEVGDEARLALGTAGGRSGAAALVPLATWSGMGRGASGGLQ
jgi:hypothetical protein